MQNNNTQYAQVDRTISPLENIFKSLKELQSLGEDIDPNILYCTDFWTARTYYLEVLKSMLTKENMRKYSFKVLSDIIAQELFLKQYEEQFDFDMQEITYYTIIQQLAISDLGRDRIQALGKDSECLFALLRNSTELITSTLTNI